MENKIDPHSHQLNCCICHKICKHIQTLPCCHATACKSCLKEWISKQEICPHCGKRLRKPKPFCKIHHKPLDYYCETCDQYLCSDCLLEQLQSENRKHSNHKIIANSSKNTKIDDGQPFEDFENHLKNLKSYFDLLNRQLDALLKQKLDISTRKLNTFYQSTMSFESLKREIESLYTEKQQNYKKISNSLEEQMIKLQSILEESEIILTSNDPKLVPTAQNNIDKIKKIRDEFVPTIPEPPSLNFPNKLCPPLESFNVKIPDFNKYLSDIQNSIAENDYIYSDEKTLFNYLWRVKIFPNGTQAGKGTHLSVYVELLKGDQSPTSFVYQVEIIPKNEKYSNVTRRYTSVFQPSDSWGWNKIISINSLLAGYLDNEGALSLTISLGPNSYAFCIQQNKDEYNRISKEFKQLKKEIEELRRRKNKDLEVEDNSNCMRNNNEL